MTDKWILIVEDELLVAEGVRRKLLRLGYWVQAVAVTGEEAVRLAAELRPNLVLMDIGLPGEMNGVAAAGEIRIRFDIPVVYLTAHSDEDTLAQTKLTEPFGYVLEPFESRDLRSTVEMALYKHAQEKKLRESEERYRSLFEAAKDHIFVLDREFRYVMVNPSALKAGGFALEDVVGRGPQETFPEDAEFYLSQYRQVFETGEPVWFERELSLPDGAHWFSVTLSPIKDARGDVIALTGISRDITERKQAEEKLSESETRFRAVVENGIEGYVMLGADRKVKYFSPSYARMIGYTLEEIIGQSGIGFVHPDDQAATASAVADILQNPDRPRTIEYRLRHKDGHWFWVESIGANMLNDPHIRAIVVNSHNITERKRAEEALRASEARYRALFDNSVDAVLLTAPDGRILAANDAACRMLGRTEEEICQLGRNGIVDTSDPRLPAALEERARTGKFKGELTCVRKDGTKIPGEISSAVFQDQDGHARTSMIIRDITERKQAERALRDSRNMLQTVLDAIPAAVFWKDRDSIYLGGNRTWLEAAGLKSSEKVVGKNDYDLPWEEEQAKSFREDDRRVIESGIPKYDIVEPYRRADGTYAWAKTNKVPLRDTEGRVIGVLGTYEDITERKQAEEALHHSLEQTARGKRLLLAISQAARAVQRAHTIDEVHQTIGEGLTAIGLQANILALTSDRMQLAFASTTFLPAVLKKAARLTGLSPAGYRFPLQPGGIHERCVVQRETIYSEGRIEHLAEALPGPLRPLAALLISLLGMEKSIIAPLVVGDETVGILSVAGSDLSESDVPAITAFASQASIALENARLFEELHATQQRLADLSRRLVAVQEAERRHLARELHDQVGQTLTGLKLVLQMSDQQRDESSWQAKLQTAQGLIDDLAARVEDLSLDLRPSMLDDLGLLPTLLWHSERYTAQTGVQVRFQHVGVAGRRFAPELETAAYRLVQEALTNVARHAGTTEVLVRLWARQDVLGVQIQDAGCGFDPASVLAGSQSTGLNSMRERVALLNGELTIESAPGAGTRLMAELPRAARDGGHNNEGDL
jgi:PAS domain S-box-containing protein